MSLRRDLRLQADNYYWEHYLMRISYHHYETKKANNGALYFYTEASRLLSELSVEGVSVEPHNFFEIAQLNPAEIASFVRGLGRSDVLVSNVGPYAHLYHYLRERYGGNFRILRDVRTSSWAGYLLQEELAGPLTRPGDLVLFPSEFCRRYFCRHFANHLNASNTAVCYPLTHSFPAIGVATKRNLQNAPRIGYLGRIGHDKSIRRLIEFFSMVYHDDRKATLHLAGHISEIRGLQKIQRQLISLGVPADRLKYHGHMPYTGIWRFFEQIDTFFYPMASSVESFGRVLVEAQHAGVPTVAADYGAAAEILPRGNLLDLDFFTDREFDLSNIFSFGEVRLDHALETMQRSQVGEPLSRAACYQPKTYLDFVLGERQPDALKALSPLTQAFIDAGTIRHDTLYTNNEDLLQVLECLFVSFRHYNNNDFTSRLVRCATAMFGVSPYANRRVLFLNRLLDPEERMIPRHAIEHCSVVGYRPHITLSGNDSQIASNHMLQRMGVLPNSL